MAGVLTFEVWGFFRVQPCDVQERLWEHDPLKIVPFIHQSGFTFKGVKIQSLPCCPFHTVCLQFVVSGALADPACGRDFRESLMAPGGMGGYG